MNSKYKTLRKGLLFILFASYIKVIYDYLVLHALPSSYIHSISYGVEYSSDKYVISWMIFLVVSVITYKATNFSNCYYLGVKILYTLYYIPINSSYYVNNSTYTFIILSTIFWINFTLAAYFFLPHNEDNKDSNIVQIEWGQLINERLLYILCLAICVACVIYGYQYNGLKLTLNITNIYDDRAAFVGSTNFIQSILFHFGGSVIVPISMLYALNKKKPLLFSVGLIAELALFSIARQKSNLFLILLIVVSFFTVKFNCIHKIEEKILMIFSIMLTVVFLQYRLYGSNDLFMLFVRRMMYYPAWLSNLYYDYFSNHKLLLFSQEVFIVNHFKIGRYDESVLSLINNQYFNGYVPSPNNGMFSEAYMHFGAISVFFYPFLMLFLSKLFFNSLKYYSTDSQLLLSIRFMMGLINIPMSGGVFCITYFLLIPFTYFVLKNNQKKEQNNERDSSKYNM